MELEALLRLVAEEWVCTAHEYPAIAKLDDAGRKQFMRKHVLLHLLKQTGALAEALERHDHLPPIPVEQGLVDALAKLLINTLQLANIDAVPAHQLVMRIGKILEHSNA